jgi:hypothetical protein
VIVLKLNIWAFSFAVAIWWGLMVFLAALWIILFEGETGDLLALGHIYRGYNVSIAGAFIGLVWAFFDGLVGGLIFAWLYNLLVGRGAAGAPAKAD